MENTNKDKTKEINQRGRGNIALLGFMGSGKTTIGQQLAQKVGWQFMDTDDLIEEKTSLSISLIFERWGEEHFRSLEKVVLEEVASKKNIILATGGGLPAQEDNWQILREHFLTIFLQVDFSILYQRIKGDSRRPLLSQHSTPQELEKLYQKRLIYYERSDVIINGNRSEEEIVEEILYHEKISSLWRKR